MKQEDDSNGKSGTKKLYHYIVEGWIHPKSGSDYPFKKGYYLTKPNEEVLKNHIIQKVLSKSMIKNDFVINEVSKEVWLKSFNYQ